MTDLFSAAPADPQPPKPSEPRIVRLKSSGTTVFLHACADCGESNASFGERYGKGSLGRWYCFRHWQARQAKRGTP